jgi:hypothetical protein
MATAKLKTYKYYDCHELAKRFGFKDFTDFIDKDSVSSNGCLVTLYDPGDIQQDDIDCRVRENQRRIYKELGEIDIHVWW